jgi:hypothetical protein
MTMQFDEMRLLLGGQIPIQKARVISTRLIDVWSQ